LRRRQRAVLFRSIAYCKVQIPFALHNRQSSRADRPQSMCGKCYPRLGSEGGIRRSPSFSRMKNEIRKFTYSRLFQVLILKLNEQYTSTRVRRSLGFSFSPTSKATIYVGSAWGTVSRPLERVAWHRANDIVQLT
jgi:hypothetical protein